MNLILPSKTRMPAISNPAKLTTKFSFRNLPLPFLRRKFDMNHTYTMRERRNSCFVSEPSLVKKDEPTGTEGEGELLLLDDGGDEDEGADYLEEEEAELYVGDGVGGGGIKLAGAWWDEEALRIAKEVCQSFDGNLDIYAFKTMSHSSIQVRIERLTNKSGSPTMGDIEAFSKIYRARLNEAELAKSIPEDTYLEVSSPGVERVVRIPQDLERFKDRTMYVRYTNGVDQTEGEGILRLASFDLERQCCTWGIADVRINREKAGKGRALNKKQRDWRLDTSFASVLVARIYSKC